jgi:transcriptional regulator GlxA family with amidase domain
MVAYAHGPAVAERILQELQCCVPPELLPAFRYCLEHPENPLSVEQVAAGCGIKRRALEYRFWKAGLPPPAGCCARCRLLLVVHHLEHQTDSVEHVALEHAFATSAALRKSAVRHLGMTINSLRRKGAFEGALAGSIDDIRQGTRPLSDD